MKKRICRNHSPTFKSKVALAAIEGDKTISELAQQFDVHTNQITKWKSQLLDNADAVFDGKIPDKEPAVDVKQLHAKIGELNLENDFSESALNKAGLRSARK